VPSSAKAAAMLQRLACRSMAAVQYPSARPSLVYSRLRSVSVIVRWSVLMPTLTPARASCPTGRASTSLAAAFAGVNGKWDVLSSRPGQDIEVPGPVRMRFVAGHVHANDDSSGPAGPDQVKDLPRMLWRVAPQPAENQAARRRGTPAPITDRLRDRIGHLAQCQSAVAMLMRREARLGSPSSRGGATNSASN
jgi:hypothetical protein